VESDLMKIYKRLPPNVPTPLSSNFCPELDLSLLLPPDLHHCYQQLIGTLQWSVELGQIDIHLHVALSAQYLAAPCTGHLDQASKAHLCSHILFDDTVPCIDETHSPRLIGKTLSRCT
jgi:hypothetical protein